MPLSFIIYRCSAFASPCSDFRAAPNQSRVIWFLMEHVSPVAKNSNNIPNNMHLYQGFSLQGGGDTLLNRSLPTLEPLPPTPTCPMPAPFLLKFLPTLLATLLLNPSYFTTFGLTTDIKLLKNLCITFYIS